MSDRWSQILYEGAFGGKRIDIRTLQDDVNRALVIHEYPKVDGGDLEDLGAKPRRTTCQLVFLPFSDDIDPDAFTDRFNQVALLATDGETHDFVHPLLGSFPAKCESWRVSLSGDDRDFVQVDAVFVEDSTAPAAIFAVEPPGLASVVEDVQAAAAKVDAELAAYNARAGTALSSAIGATAIATTSGWETAASSARSSKKQFRNLQSEMEQLAAQINDATDQLELTTSPRRWGIYNAMNGLAEVCIRAFEAASAVVPRVFSFTVAAPIPLLAIASSIYGGGEAMARFDELRGLNDIRNPAIVPAGTVLRGYVPSAEKRRS